MVVVLMGVSGAGKTAVGEELACRLGWKFFDGDDYHSAANVSKMSAGEPLTDEDRRPWLQVLHQVIGEQVAQGADAVLACSALKQAYRDRLLAGTDQTRLVYLRGSRQLIEARLRRRRGHFFDVELLDSQFEALEEPDGALTVDIDGDIETVTSAVIASLGIETNDGSEEKRE